MGILKQGAYVCIGIVVFNWIQTWLEPRLPVFIDGYYHPAFKSVYDKFRDNLQNSIERGGSIAVYHRGVLVVDIWGGYADLESKRTWSKDTMTLGFSATKGIAAIIVAKMVEDGFLDYNRPVKDYWPEFAQNGKDNVTVEMLVSHQAGLVAFDETISLLDIRDNPVKVEKMIASQKPFWPPGTRHGYHSLSYGLYVDTLLKKVDPKGRDTTQIFYEDFVKPYDLDIFMNTPLEQYHRVARLYKESIWKMIFKSIVIPKYRAISYNVLTDSSFMGQSSKAIVEFTGGDIEAHNNPTFRQIPCSCCYSTGAARGYAKLYSILANGGQYDGKQLLSKDTIKKLGVALVTGRDATMGIENNFSRGTIIGQNARGDPVLGHPGHGGQNAFADLKNEIGLAYVTNHISLYGLGDDPRFLSLEKEVYAALDAYIATL
ncbi:hypothetical protein ACF0H5_022270 [Mactra antiquata]